MFRTYVPVLVCAALAFAGCGGDDDDSSSGDSASPELTKAEYVKQGNQICSDTKNDQQEFDDKIDDIDRGDLEAAAPILEDAFKVTREGFDRLKALSPPAAEQAKVDAFLTSSERLLDSRDRLIQAARDDDRPAGQKAATDGEKLSDEQEPLAKAAGLTDCSNIF